MRKISPIHVAAFLFLVLPISTAAERLRLGDFSTEKERKEDERVRKRGDVSQPAPSPELKPLAEKTPVPLPGREGARGGASSGIPPPALPPDGGRKPMQKKASTTSAPKPAVAPDDARKKSDGFYLQALFASQNKNFDEAAALCRQALKLNPDNLQAQRMMERLELQLRR